MNVKNTIAASLMVLGLSTSAGVCGAGTISNPGGEPAGKSSATSMMDSHVGKRVYVKLKSEEDERGYSGVCIAQDGISIIVRLDGGREYQLFYVDIEYIEND
jgi:hypothetical protein